MVSVSLDCWCKAGLENLIRLAKKEALFIRKHPKVCYSLWHHPSRWQLQIWAGADQGWVEGRRQTVRLSRSQGGSQSPPILLFFPLWWPPSRVPRFPLGSGCTWDESEERPSVQSLPHASLTFTLAQQFDWCLPYLKHQTIKLHQTNDKIKLSMKLHICGTFCAVNWCCMRGATLKVTWNVQDFIQDAWKSFLNIATGETSWAIASSHF